MRHASRTTDSTTRNGHGHTSSANKIIVLENAFRELVSCSSFEQVKEIRDQARPSANTRKARAGLELQNKAAEVKLRERAQASCCSPCDPAAATVCPNRLSTARRSNNWTSVRARSTRWQKLATIPEADFAEHLASGHRGVAELTTAYFLRIATSREKKCTASHDIAASQMADIPDRQRNTSSSAEIIRELLDHCHTLNHILAPFYEGEGPVELGPAERRYVGRLVHDVEALLADLHTQAPGRNGTSVENRNRMLRIDRAG